MTWTDRVAGVELDAPSGRVAYGQLRWEGPGSLAIRQALAEPGDAALPSAEGTFHSPTLSNVRVDPRTIPDPDALRCLRLMGAGIAKRIGAPFLEWLDEPPLMPPVDETLEETELEQVTKRKLPHLESVCRGPRTHLKLEEERQLVGRCKRPSTRAPMVLAARSEDWDRKTLWGIRPKKVLGLVRDELYDLYENRLSVGLVDRLDEALTQRVREVRRVVNQARRMKEWEKLLQDGHNYRRAERMCSLWGELWAEEGLLARAERALKRLTQLRRRVLALKDSMLYRRIGGQRRIIHLRMTNLMSHDDVYRGVAELWQAWERHLKLGNEDPQARWSWEQEAFRGMRLFGVLVVLRALDTLRFVPKDEHFECGLEPGMDVVFEGPGGDLRLQWLDHDDLRLEPQRGEPFRVCSLPSMLEAAPAPGPWLESLPSRPAVVLHLDADQARAPLAERTRLRGPGPVDRPTVHVGVAPWQLESVERVARALRWRIWMELLSGYGRELALPSPSWKPPTPISPWLEAGSTTLRVVAPSLHVGWSALEKRVADQQTELGRLDAQLASIDARDPRRNRDRLHLKQSIDFQRTELSEDLEVREAVVSETAALASLLRCPVCRLTASGHDFRHVEGRFRVSCSCGCSWGLRDCRACQQTFPYLSNPANVPGADALEVDTAYGCDVLTFPLDDDVYLCPHCGQRSDGEPDVEH